MRLILFLLIVFALVSSGCTTTGPAMAPSGAAVNSETPVISPTQPGETYWIVSTSTLIGTPYYSGVLLHPTDDKETVAAAVNAWGRDHGQRTGVESVYPFSSSEEAQKFRSEKGGVDLKIARDDLIPRLCVGQSMASATDYWVISVEKTEYPVMSPVDKVTKTNYISGPILLPPHSDKAVSRAVSNWIMGTGGRGLSNDDANTRKFAYLGDAEAFISKSGMQHLDLTAETVNKYLCANQPDESQPTPKSQPKH
jgi:hypothetical protein